MRVVRWQRSRIGLLAVAVAARAVSAFGQLGLCQPDCTAGAGERTCRGGYAALATVPLLGVLVVGWVRRVVFFVRG